MTSEWMPLPPEPELVSVIMPTYNRARLIGETLDSVLGQSHRPIEVLIVDDGSTDGTADVIGEWSQARLNDPTFRVHCFRQPNSGAQVARNRALQHARGEYIQFLDSDDCLGGDKLALQVQVLRDTPGSLVYGPWYRTPCGMTTGGEQTFAGLQRDFVRLCLAGKFIAAHALLWPRSAVEQLGPWDESLCAAEDGEYLMRAVCAGWGLRFCPGSWVFYRPPSDPASNLSASYSAHATNSRIRVIEKLSEQLAAMGQLGHYRNDLAQAYLRLALSSATRHPQSSIKCLDLAEQLTGRKTVTARAIGMLSHIHGAMACLIGERRATASIGRVRDVAKRVLCR